MGFGRLSEVGKEGERDRELESVGGSGIGGKLGGADRGSVAKPIRGQQNPKTTTTAPSAAGGDDRTILYAAGAAVVAVVVAIVLMSQ